MSARVVVLGSLNRDYVVQVPRLPVAGQTVTGAALLTFSGGKGANQALAAARLGARVTLVGRTGDDDAGRALVEGLAAEGVDVSGVSRDHSAPTGAALILVEEGGQNLIAVAPGANATVGEEEVTRVAGCLRPGDLLLLQLEIPIAVVRAAVLRAASLGARVILNAAPPAKLDSETLRGLEVLVVNEDEAQALAGRPLDEAPAALAERGPAAVVVTLGERGAHLSDGQGAVRVAPPVVRAVDATAAGDAFVGGLAAALAAGAGLRRAVSLANAAGAAATTVMGAQASLPRREDLQRLFGAWETPTKGLLRSEPA
jgi:ribokinase